MKKKFFYATMIGLALSLAACDGTGETTVTSGNSAQEETAANRTVDENFETDQYEGSADTQDDSSEPSENYDDSIIEESYEEGISDSEQGPANEDNGGNAGNEDIDLDGLSGKHGRAYVYRWVGNEYLRDGVWEFSECDGYIYDGEAKLERTLTIYRYSNTSSIEYMLEYEGDWGEFWHVNYDYAPDCTYFDNVESGTVTVSGNRAVWESDYGEYREIYSLSSTHEFDD